MYWEARMRIHQQKHTLAKPCFFYLIYNKPYCRCVVRFKLNRGPSACRTVRFDFFQWTVTPLIKLPRSSSMAEFSIYTKKWGISFQSIWFRSFEPRNIQDLSLVFLLFPVSFMNLKVKVRLFYLPHARLYREYITSSEMYSLHLTHPKWTHTRSSGQPCYSARGAVGGSVSCSRTPQSWYWRRRERWLFTPPTYNPCRTWDSNPQPLDYESDSLTIRPRLS